MYKSYGSKYFRAKDFPYVCFYCGEPSSDKEHVVPKSIVGQKTHIIRSCHECNLFAADNVFYDIYDKQEFIKDKIRKRYKKILALKNWDEDELDELSSGLRKRVEVAIWMKEKIQERLDWSTTLRVLVAVKILQERDTGSDFAQHLAELSTQDKKLMPLFCTIDWS